MASISSSGCSSSQLDLSERSFNVLQLEHWTYTSTVSVPFAVATPLVFSEEVLAAAWEFLNFLTTISHKESASLVDSASSLLRSAHGVPCSERPLSDAMETEKVIRGAIKAIW